MFSAVKDKFRIGYAGLLTSGSQIALLALGFHVEAWWAWPLCLGLIALVSVFAWVSVLRRVRAFTDTPTSQIATAAQGYVELSGRGKRLDGLPVLSPLTQLPCLWYRYRVERRSNDKWVHDSSGESHASFLLVDATGTCVVDPEGAEILAARCDTWQQCDHRYRQWLILEQESVYVIGGFRTEVAGELDYSVAEEVKQILAEWKNNRPQLLQRFDLDQDGELHLREWELARAQARREAEQRRRELHGTNDLHFMGPPADGRLYLISTLTEKQVMRRYRWWAAVHVAIFFAALVALAKLAELGFPQFS